MTLLPILKWSFVVLLLSMFSAGTSKRRLISSDLQCSACEVAMAVLSDILEESANSTETMLHGHRVVGSGYNKKLYANSELRVHDALDELCKHKKFSEYSLVGKTDSQRFMEVPEGPEFDSLRKAATKNSKVTKDIKRKCQDLIDEHEDVVIAAVMAGSSTASELRRAVCMHKANDWSKCRERTTKQREILRQRQESEENAHVDIQSMVEESGEVTEQDEL
eukprot:TRINITY_DN42096_c0_g1_i1.p1 TRINITY_DN42096_c0_g1~~TRINITY_DN42096_c0_g1_i1.p1  ORF type:complete len:221 (-),score=33.22 TRINITY_DN42096_c0_g1_i1:28-690(-)